MISEEHKIKIDNEVLKLAKNKLKKHTCQFFERKEGKFLPYASGILAKFYNTFFIISAAHVTNYAEESDFGLFLPLNGKLKQISGNYRFCIIENSRKVDIGYIKLSDLDLISELEAEYAFLTIDKIRHQKKAILNSLNYFVLGYPVNNVEYIDGKTITYPNSYFTTALNRKSYKRYNLNDDDWFIVNMSGKGKNTDGNVIKIDDQFYGLSGCGLWLLLYIFNQQTQEYEVDYRLVGIMTDFKKGRYFCLIGNKIHLLIKSMVINESFSFREISIKVSSKQ